MNDATRNDARRYLAELLGTALLVIGGAGTAVLAPKAGQVGIALDFGLTPLVLACAIGPISGCHINPAVPIGRCIARRLSSRRRRLRGGSDARRHRRSSTRPRRRRQPNGPLARRRRHRREWVELVIHWWVRPRRHPPRNHLTAPLVLTVLRTTSVSTAQVASIALVVCRLASSDPDRWHFGQPRPQPRPSRADGRHGSLSAVAVSGGTPWSTYRGTGPLRPDAHPHQCRGQGAMTQPPAPATKTARPARSVRRSATEAPFQNIA
jgi:hypothetical protein